MKILKNLGISVLLGVLATSVVAKENVKSVPKEVQKTEVTEQQQVALQDLNSVNINTATAAELKDKLVGIGTKKAQAIVEYRENNGTFLSVEQITEVSGIGKATLEKNRERILVN
ncbi:competence protein ComEA helix-hairpin-helix repeat region [Phocoenobacter uteri]|uniref:Competence protein ComEA helix-hairpin-helix repeat region n=1 Tax=Phocoenobacter uteri TaxID=146806 RepID=A0A379CBW5_9PAST|nr:helix-hairpin-helix domain-containing protein [Phocoenobacter uteri]MDG6881773.1 transporter [Phocoenobacter uteri]SUB59810.1 competence protein ComEA helix-hairpin-helix repeat region [Phocoenobacter uteri]